MKKKLFTLVALLLSAIVIYGGSGVNTCCFYCCNDCCHEGIPAVVEHKCSKIERHQDHGRLITHNCGQHIAHCPNGCCGVKRISIHWTSYWTKNINLEPITINLSFSALPAANCVCRMSWVPETDFIHKPSQKPPNLSKQDYLSLLAALII